MDRSDVCRYIRENFEELKWRAMERFASRLLCMDPEDVCKRFVNAGKKYGSFSLHSIDTTEEIEAEHTDLISYEALDELQAQE